ncbi:MAG: RES domain-containing protein [Chloroflexota bacterium]
MQLERLSRPFDGAVYCHVPGDAELDPDLLPDGGEGDRWNHRDERTVYLAADPGVAIAELARHVAPRIGGGGIDQRIWEVRLRLRRVLDLNEPEVKRALRLRDELGWLLDRRRCREVASHVRSSDEVEAMIVPSAAFPDQTDRWSLVLFPERVDRPLRDVIRDGREVGRVQLAEEARPERRGRMGSAATRE